MSEQLNRLIDKGRRQLASAEAEKRVLYDRTIGGPIAPRPSEQFIREIIGKLKSQAQIDKEAVAQVYPKMSQRAADSWLVRNNADKTAERPPLRNAWEKTANPDRSEQSTQKAKEAWRKAEAQPKREISASKEQLRDAWNTKADPARAKQRQPDRDQRGHER
jgi:hypothetical protein